MEKINFSIKKMRLGNHVRFKNKLYMINTLYLDQPVIGIRCIEDEIASEEIVQIHYITPIAITPELLEDIGFHITEVGGFDETDFYSNSKKYNIPGQDSPVQFEIWKSDGKWTLELLDINQDCLVSFSIDYLHEIENLIFYITNKEFPAVSDILKGKSLTKKSTEMNVVIVDSLGNIVGKHAFDITNNLDNNYYVSITI